jgi:hypothetical protein
MLVKASLLRIRVLLHGTQPLPGELAYCQFAFDLTCALPASPGYGLLQDRRTRSSGDNFPVNRIMFIGGMSRLP